MFNEEDVEEPDENIWFFCIVAIEKKLQKLQLTQLIVNCDGLHVEEKGEWGSMFASEKGSACGKWVGGVTVMASIQSRWLRRNLRHV